MCGILGLSGDYTVFFDEEHDSNIKFKEKFRDALTLLEHRGPDAMGEKLFFDDNVYIGHTRLAIQDLSSAGTQPMASDNKKELIYKWNYKKYKKINKKNNHELNDNFFEKITNEIINNKFKKFNNDTVTYLRKILK